MHKSLRPEDTHAYTFLLTYTHLRACEGLMKGNIHWIFIALSFEAILNQHFYNCFSFSLLYGKSMLCIIYNNNDDNNIYNNNNNNNKSNNKSINNNKSNNKSINNYNQKKRMQIIPTKAI